MKKSKEVKYKTQNINGIDYYYYVFPTNALGKRKRIYGRTIGELEEKIEQYKEEKHVIPIKSNNFSALVLYYLQTACFTRKHQLNELYHFLDSKIKDSIIDIDINDKFFNDRLNDYFYYLQKYYNKEMVNKLYDFISSVIEFAQTISLLEDIKLEKNKGLISYKQIKTKTKKYFLSEEEARIILKECSRIKTNGNYFYGVGAKVIALILCTGLKTEQLIDLSLENINIHKKMLYITYKNEPRTIPLCREAVSVLSDFNKSNKSFPFEIDTDYLFITTEGTKVVKGNIEKTLKNIVDNSGLIFKPNLSDIENYFGYHLLKKGYDLSVVTYLCCHKNIGETYRIYEPFLRDDFVIFNHLDLLTKSFDNFDCIVPRKSQQKALGKFYEMSSKN